MAPGFSTDLKELVRSRTSLVDLVGETVALTPIGGGRDFVGLCPFHDDHNPSFHVYPERQSYKCWSCSEGGDCFSFIMETQRVGFREALELLARWANVELPAGYRGSGGDRDEKQRLYEALAWAEGEFHRTLLSTPEGGRARKYLAERGFSDETIRNFRLGYAADEWDRLVVRARGKFTPAQLVTVGLAKAWERGREGHYDFFRDRVMFPVRDERGRVVAFGGRVLPGYEGNAGKYMNSSETPVYSKSRVLFGFDTAREAIRKADCAVVVEGYTDCILARQHGLANIVGTLGTALTEAHVAVLKRFARRVVLLFDGDEAGQNAAERTVQKLLAEEIDLRILTLPEGQDPADFVAARGGPALAEFIDEAPEAWEFKLKASIGRYGLTSLDGRQRVLDEMLELAAGVPRLIGTPREHLIFSRLVQRLGLTEHAVRQRLKELRDEARRRQNQRPADKTEQTKPAIAPTREERAERELLEIVLTRPDLLQDAVTEVGPDDFTSDGCRRLFETCRDLDDHGVSPTFDRVLSEVEDSDLKRLVVSLDDDSRRKNIAQHLREDQSEEPAARPALLELTLTRLKRRREAQSHELFRGRLAMKASDGTGAIDSETRQLLEQLTQFNRRRAT
ncbi:MAG: DNA primase [Planctomycetes bacterium]|nr:DNA primase [Planctomycetota bacterium]